MRPKASIFDSDVLSYTMVGMMLMAGLLIALIISTGDVTLGAVVVMIPFAIGFLLLVFYNPYYGMLTYLHYSFFFIGLNRYMPGVTLGLTVDAILFLTTLSLLTKLRWDNLKSLHTGIFYVNLLWFVYTSIQLFNPEGSNREAWFYAVRGLSLYGIQVIPGVLICMGKKEDMDNFIKIVFGWAILSSLWGLKQVHLHLDSYESFWLGSGGAITHMVNGHLRAFSFYSDAGQFGTTMAYASVIALILALGPYNRVKKLQYWGIFLIAFMGFNAAGSRGPLFIIIFGFIWYLLLIKKFRTLLIGFSVAWLLFLFLKFTTIGNTNYSIFRLRTALDPHEASLMVRLKNQDVLRTYLENLPIGSGIGTTDTWAKRFYETSFLADIPTDSWFVRIWVENGVYGLGLHFFTLCYVLVIGYAKTNNARDPDLKQKLIGLYAGYFGILVASFGNPILGQAPVGAIMYISSVYLCIGDRLDDEVEMNKKGLLQPVAV